MKKSIIVPFLLISMFCFSQGSNIVYDFQGGIPVTADATTNLKLPLTISFTYKFNGKSVKFLNEDGTQVIALNNSKFGTGNLSKDGETSTFHIIINEDRTVNPGDERINPTNVILQIESTKINLNIASATSDDGTNAPDKSEEYFAGRIYYDAIKLSTTTNKKTIVAILKAYEQEANLKDNPYLSEIFGADYFTKSLDGKNAGVMQGGISPATFLKNLGNTDVTYFAAGLARFLAERTKDELNEAFFNRMKEQLNAFPELKTTFPKSASILEVIETFSYASVIQVLKEAFETDIQNLPENLYNIKGLTVSDCSSLTACSCGKKSTCKKSPAGLCEDCERCKCEKRMQNITAFFKTMEGQWIGLGMFTVKEATQSSNSFDLLASVSVSKELKGIKSDSKQFSNFDDYNLASSIELANLLSQSLQSKEENQIWITPKELNILFKDNDLKTLKIFLGLLLAKEQKGDVNIEFYYSDGQPKTFGKMLIDIHSKANDVNNKANVYEQTKTLIGNTYSAFSSANSAIKKIVAATEKSIEAEPQALFDYYRTFTASLKPIANSEILKTISGRTNIGSRYNSIEQFLNPSVDLAYHIATKKYSAALYDAVLILNSTNVSVFEKPVAKSFIKYGTLISTVANAQSSDEVNKAIEASVLPVGSYSIKQNSRASFSINSYVGAYYSFSKEKSVPVGGLIAPIGFNFSQGVKKDNFFNKYLLMGGYSINLQLLDLGALVNYYLIKGDTATIPNDFKIKLSNIFAPGVSVNYNIKKTPLSLAFGTQYIPTLYKYELINGVNELTQTNSWRWQISLLVDIPLYNLKVWDFKK